MNTLHVKKGDTVVLLSGNDKGKTGKVLDVFPKEERVLVEGVGTKVKHQRPRKAGQQGQIIEKQHPVHASKVMEVGKHKEKQSKKKK